VNPAVVVRDVCREFRTLEGRRTLFRFLRAQRQEARAPARKLLALQHIALEVPKGERLAVIGNNAAGKTTLLKIIAGLLRPTSGSVEVEGDMTLLTALGLGMLDELSVADNLMLYGAIYGVDRRRMQSLLPDILEWAELDDFLDAKLKTLSTGTRARLAFAVVRHIQGQVFLFDEVFSAGDVSFRKKCREFFESSTNPGRTMIIATHDMEFVRTSCSRALWLDHGKQVGLGESSAIVDQYLESQSRPHRPGSA
jgi:homopolymeric O-antigen transport system ATP-binding protein